MSDEYHKYVEKKHIESRDKYKNILLEVSVRYEIYGKEYNLIYKNGTSEDGIHDLYISKDDGIENWLINFVNLNEKSFTDNSYKNVLEGVREVHKQVTNKQKLKELWDDFKDYIPDFDKEMCDECKRIETTFRLIGIVYSVSILLKHEIFYSDDQGKTFYKISDLKYWMDELKPLHPCFT